MELFKEVVLSSKIMSCSFGIEARATHSQIHSPSPYIPISAVGRVVIYKERAGGIFLGGEEKRLIAPKLSPLPMPHFGNKTKMSHELSGHAAK